MIKFAKEQFFLSANELVDSLSKTDSKSYWSLIKKLMKGTGSNYTIPPLIDTTTNELVYVDRSKANLLNEYFCTISSINDTGHIPPNIPLKTEETLSRIVIDEKDVKDILQILELGKACGDDTISHQMLKATSDTICKPLTLLFNFSLQTSQYTHQFGN